MPMNLRLSSCPVLENGPIFISMAITQDVLPSRVVVVSTLSEALAARDAYADEVKATGKPAAIFAGKHPRCKGRKPPGFDAATSKKHLVNV